MTTETQHLHNHFEAITQHYTAYRRLHTTLFRLQHVSLDWCAKEGVISGPSHKRSGSRVEAARGPPCSHGPRTVHRVNRNVAGKRTGDLHLPWGSDTCLDVGYFARRPPFGLACRGCDFRNSRTVNQTILEFSSRRGRISRKFLRLDLAASVCSTPTGCLVLSQGCQLLAVREERRGFPRSW